MRSHAKASTAGSNQRQAGRLGRIFRGAFATRGASPASKGSGASNARRLAIPVGVFVALMVFAIPASAIKTHVFKETFGSAAQPSFGAAQGLAVDQSNGDVLVMDAGAGTISRYKADGTPDDFSALGTNVIDGQGSGDETPRNGLGFASPFESQIAVDDSGGATDGNIYVTQSFPNAINVFSKTGAYLGQLTAAGATDFSEACGVAVDSSGAVYVGDFGSGIHKFVPSANPPLNTDNTATFTTTTNPCTLAAGAGPSAGFLFAAQYNGPISKLDSGTGELKYTVDPDSYATITVDPESGYVYGASATSGTTIKVFDASGVGGATTIGSFKSQTSVQGLAVNGTSGNVYVSHSGAAELEVFGGLTTFPGVANDPPTNLTGTSATLNGTVNPDGVALTECKFEYGLTAAYGQTVPCAESLGSIGSGSSPVPVHADISDLVAGTVYHFRLAAANANGSLPGSDANFQTLGPVIKDAGVTNVVRTDAVVRAKINPEGAPTTYHVEYGPNASYGQSTTESSVGSDGSDHNVSVALEGLDPATTYHWRVIATNADGVASSSDRTFTTPSTANADTSCANQAFRYGAGANLPDCRAYEMVSPVDKNGGEIKTLCNFQCSRTAVNQSSLDGNKITYSSLTAFGDAISGPHSNQYIATRGADGWSTHAISPRRTATAISFSGYDPEYDLETEFKAFTPDLSSALLINDDRKTLTDDAINGFVNVYQRNNADDSYQTLTTNEPQFFFEQSLNMAVMGLTDDGSHALLAAKAALTPDAAHIFGQQLYESSGGELHLVSVMPNGEPSPKPSIAGTNGAYFSFFDASHGRLALDHVMSDDGSRVFWSDSSFIEFVSGPLEGPVYVRKNPAEQQSALTGSNECTEPAKACTVVVSESPTSRFWTATPDGSKALVTTGSLTESKAQLSVFDVDAETTIPIADGVRGVSGASDDLSHIYFVSTEVLDGGATADQRNLYLYEDGTFTFIATLSGIDTAVAGTQPPGAVQPEPTARSVRVTPDGRHFAFMSTRSLTGYDNTDAINGEADSEIFLYDAGAQQLTCVSCNPSGSRPTGFAYQQPYQVVDRPFATGGFAAAWLPTSPTSIYDARPLSDDGGRLFFNSYDALVPGDTNGQQDVYQWEAEGTGGCDKPEGCIDLLSTGHSPQKSAFVDASPDGHDVFIETNSSIDPRDTYGIDIYDVREGGGYPPSPTAPLPCAGDACQSIPAAPNDQTPSSAAFKGAGDPTPHKARKDCRSRKASKGKSQAKKHKKAKRCRSAKRGAGR